MYKASLLVKLLRYPPTTLAIFMLALGIIYLQIILLGYTFVPNPISGLVMNTVTTTIIIGITVIAVNSRKNKTQVNTVFSALLPLIAIIYIITKEEASDINTIVYVTHAYIILLCCIVLFFSCSYNLVINIGLGIIYTAIHMLIFFVLYIMMIFANFGENTVMKSEISPGSIYIAEIIASDEGAMGGSTLVDVTRLNRDINLFIIGELKKAPKRIYSGRWGEFDMALRWENDEILYINEIRYDID